MSQNSPWFKFIFLLPGNCKDYENEFLQKELKYNLRLVTLPTPRKASGSVLKTIWSFDSNKHILNQLGMWLNRRKAFFRHCIPRSISFKDTAIVRNFYPKKFHP